MSFGTKAYLVVFCGFHQFNVAACIDNGILAYHVVIFGKLCCQRLDATDVDNRTMCLFTSQRVEASAYTLVAPKVVEDAVVVGYCLAFLQTNVLAQTDGLCLFTAADNNLGNAFLLL